MKRFFYLILTVSLLFSLTGCSQGPYVDPGPQTEPRTSQQESQTPSEEAPDEEIWLPYDRYGQMILTDRDASGENGAVSSSSWYATKAGLDILKAGGNAADAGYAVAYTLGVVEPFTSGIGGGGFITYYDAASGKVTMLDFRESAPASSSPLDWLDENGQMKHYTDKKGNEMTSVYSQLNRLGGLAVGVPGFVAGWEEALESLGSGALSRAELMKAAIGYAEEGYLVTPTMQSSSQDELSEISVMDELSAYYLDDFGFPPETNSVIKNPDLADTYRLIAENGPEAFYSGKVADAIIAAVTKYDGKMSLDDLASYRVIEREPLESDYRGYKVYALPPSSSGGTHLIEILNILENFDMSSIDVNSSQYVHLIAEATKIAFADRAAYMADTDFADVPLDVLTSKEYASRRASEISEGNGAYAAGDVDGEHSSTTSFSVVDKDGNMLTCTQTIGDFYGSKIAVDGCGFILNDEMYDFDIDPQSVNCVAGGKRPLSSIAPTLVLTPGGEPFVTIGTPGGSRIFTVIAQVIQRMIDYGMDIQEAVETVRIFASDDSSLTYEEDGISALSQETLDELEAMGYTLVPRKKLDLYFGGVQGIEKKPDGTLHAGADPRRTGKALAY